VKSFKAEAIDVDLELTTLGGEEITLKPKPVLNAKNITAMFKQWDKLEANRKETGSQFDVFETQAIELAGVYDKPKEWWLENFTIRTLDEILSHVAQTLAKVKKNTPNSKPSSLSETKESA